MIELRQKLGWGGFGFVNPSSLTCSAVIGRAIAVISSSQPIAIELDRIVSLCQQSPIGKRLPGALYIHRSALSHLDPQLQAYANAARAIAPTLTEFTLIKFHYDRPKISYLFYPDFDSDPHPQLVTSWQIDLANQTLGDRDYTTSDNPPILHRKETFVAPDYPGYETFAELTRQEEAIGLLDKRRGMAIGTLQNWLDCLAEFGVEIHDHQVIQSPEFDRRSVLPRIERHKAAIPRKDVSRPVRLALEAELFAPEATFFDYGCGYGGDVERLHEKGIVSAGWDPYYQPDAPLVSADIVNLGYVINVIECQAERREALIKAWELTQQVLIVSAQVLINERTDGQIAYGDGIITRRNTFQKYYEQEELKVYIDQVLEVDAVPVGLGVYFVFRDRTRATSFRASRFHSRASTPRIRQPSKRFEDYQELVAPVMTFFTERGRLPYKGELPTEAEILDEFRTYRRAFQLILQVTQAEEWDALSDRRRDDLLVYIALTQFGNRPKKISEFSPLVQNDIKSLFGSYRTACILADQMLFSIGDLNFVKKCCQHTPVGKQSKRAFSVHRRYLDTLDPRLRLYEGCANRTIGRLENVTTIKFHTDRPKISYHYYPDFDTDPHPVLHTSMQIDLRDLTVSYKDYSTLKDPPILHQKDRLVGSDYPNADKWIELTQTETSWGLYQDEQAIRTRQGWLQCLAEHCATIENHQLIYRQDADPEALKLAKAAHQTFAQEFNRVD